MGYAVTVSNGVGVVGSASAMLIDRGGGLIYDTVLNIIWLQDANLAATNNFGNTATDFNGLPCTLTGGVMTWPCAQGWIAAMNAADYLGYNDWRLPYESVSAGIGPIDTLPGAFGNPIVAACTGLPSAEAECRDNEMGYMFYYNLGGVYGSPETGTQSVNGVTLYDIQNDYWSGTEYNSDPPIGRAWGFRFDVGQGRGDGKLVLESPWAVRNVPEPATLALLGVGLAGLGFSRRNR